MSSTLPKLKIKFPKRSTPSNDPKADEGKGRPSKKRKSVPEHYTDKQSVQKPADDLPGRQSQAERDLYGEANKVRTQVQASTRPREGNEGLQTKPEPQAKPRLVIKYVAEKPRHADWLVIFLKRQPSSLEILCD